MAITHGKYAPAVRLASLVNAAVEQGKWPEQTELGQLEVYRGAVVDFMERNRRYLGQMDLNIRSPLVWEFYKIRCKHLPVTAQKSFVWTPLPMHRKSRVHGIS